MITDRASWRLGFDAPRYARVSREPYSELCDERLRKGIVHAVSAVTAAPHASTSHSGAAAMTAWVTADTPTSSVAVTRPAATAASSWGVGDRRLVVRDPSKGTMFCAAVKPASSAAPAATQAFQNNARCPGDASVRPRLSTRPNTKSADADHKVFESQRESLLRSKRSPRSPTASASRHHASAAALSSATSAAPVVPRAHERDRPPRRRRIGNTLGGISRRRARTGDAA